jgi:hypothetical protein
VSGSAAGGPPDGGIHATTIPVSVNALEAAYGAIPSYRATDQLINFEKIGLYWPTAIAGADPDGRFALPDLAAMGTLFDLVVYSLRITPATPLHLTGRVVDLLRLMWANVGEPYDEAALEAVRACRPTLGLALRLTEPPSLATFESDIIGGPCGVGTARDTLGRKRAFLTRTRPAAPAGTITTADLRNAETPIFTLYEDTAVSGVTYVFERYREWTEHDGERPADGLVVGRVYEGVPPS